MKHSSHRPYVARLAAAIVASGALSTAALAQALPAPPPPAPADAPQPGAHRPPRRPASPGLDGIVVAAKPYRVEIRTVDGRSVHLQLRDGTIINPTGATLVPGLRVAVRGKPEAGGTVAADELDVVPTPPDRGAAPAPGGAPPPPPPDANKPARRGPVAPPK